MVYAKCFALRRRATMFIYRSYRPHFRFSESRHNVCATYLALRHEAFAKHCKKKQKASKNVSKKLKKVAKRDT